MGSGGQVALRAAVAGDAAALAALDRLVNPSPWSEQQFAGACGAQAQCAERALVIDRDGQPQGFLVFSRVLDEICIHNIAVRPALQGRGLGQRLLVAALDQARDTGAGRCHLEVRESNLAALGLYHKLGFQRDGVRRNYYPTADGREDAVLMSRPLAEQDD